VSGLTFAQRVSAEASTDSTNYLVGDYINYSIEVKHPANINIREPAIIDSVKELEFIEKSEPSRYEQDDAYITKFQWTFSKYDSGFVSIPPIAIHYFNTKDSTENAAYTNPVDIQVDKLKVDPEADIKDVKDPFTIPFSWWTIGLIILILLLIILIIALYYMKKKKQEPVERKRVKVEIPPHRKAIKELSELEEKKLWQKGKVKEYHSEITGIIRRYFQEVFNFPALEMTSEEIREELKFNKDIQQITSEFLSNADMVKFAKFQPMASVNEEMMKQAYEIVNRTKPTEDTETSKTGENKDVQ
jgi:uncharacterized membrane protein YukC